jgi:nicotinamidase-related amidase
VSEAQVIVGVNTSAGVESTARQGYGHGVHATLATDAMTDLDPVAHDNTIACIFPRLGETGTTNDILALLMTCARCTRGPFRR